MGALGSVSVMGVFSGVPYTAAEDEKMIRFTPVSCMAPSTFTMPTTLFQ